MAALTDAQTAALVATVAFTLLALAYETTRFFIGWER